jgi:microfibrillar-associated protein 1
MSSLKNLYKPQQEIKKVNQPVDRLRAGHVPNFINEENESDEDRQINRTEVTFNNITIDNFNIGQEVLNEIESKDKRLQRLNKQINPNIEERLKVRREIYKSEIVKPDIQEAKPSREELKRKILEAPKIEQSKEGDDELLELIGNEDSEVESSESSETEDNVLLRPVFVRREDRLTQKFEEDYENEQIEANHEIETLKQAKKAETQQLIKHYIESEANKGEKNAEESTMPDDSDDINPTLEYENWKIREFKRIKASLEEDELRLKERLEIERRRQLTNEQRKEENLRLGCNETNKTQKTQLNYLQKYYHKGAFFQSESGEANQLYNRDYNLPTWEDKVDRSNLPKVMQRRRGKLFKKGQSKYTHLTAEDTTNFDPKIRVPEAISNKLFNQMGGFKSMDQFELGRKRKNNNT